MAGYTYYVFEGFCVVRAGLGTTERLMRDGSWVDYPYRWEVLSMGLQLDNEDEALAIAKRIFELADARDAGPGAGDEGRRRLR